jgi:TM2 domain-containing membrane protein YozV
MSNQFSTPPPMPSGSSSKDKTTAGLLAILLGSLGIHKFYLGGKQQKTAGIIMLVSTIIGSCAFLMGPIVIGIIALIEGIMYLTKDDPEFQATYVAGDKAWF